MSGPIEAQVERVIDGDTFDARARIWLDQDIHVAVRPKGVNAPELNARCAEERAEAKAARAFLAALLKDGDVTLSDIEADKYSGRIDAVVTLADGRDLAQAILAAGYGAPYQGGQRVSLCTQG